MFFTNNHHLLPLTPVVAHHSVRVHTRMIETSRGPWIVFRSCAQMPLFLQRVVVYVTKLLQEHFLCIDIYGKRVTFPDLEHAILSVHPELFQQGRVMVDQVPAHVLGGVLQKVALHPFSCMSFTYMPDQVDMVGHDFIAIESDTVMLHEEAQGGKNEALVAIVAEQGFPFQDGSGEELGIICSKPEHPFKLVKEEGIS